MILFLYTFPTIHELINNVLRRTQIFSYSSVCQIILASIFILDEILEYMGNLFKENELVTLEHYSNIILWAVV